ncbi:MAG: hypothetical protein QNK23_13275 [Crocinitomicaceae bacterium]|nr:hypothetical protein [Crocinitomicaceae bacterium]
MNSPATYFIIGMGIHLTFLLGHKLLRKKRIMIGASVISACLAFTAYYFPYMESLQMKNGYAMNSLYSPAIFLVIYVLSRYLFKLIFKNEPIMAGYMSLSWEQGEYRKLHLGDSLFTVATLILPMIIPLFL